MEEKRKITLFTLFFFTIGLIPFIFMPVYIDDESPTDFLLSLSSFVDDFALGNVGIASSSLPILSKIMANYNALITPILVMVMYILILVIWKPSELPKNTDFSTSHYIKIIFSTSLIYCLFLIAMCFLYIDLNDHSRLGFWGRNKHTLSLLYIVILYPCWFLLNCSILITYTYFTKNFFEGRRAIQKQ